MSQFLVQCHACGKRGFQRVNKCSLCGSRCEIIVGVQPPKKKPMRFGSRKAKQKA